MRTKYAAPDVSKEWAESRNTHIAVATAIHAIADSSRSPESICEAPTDIELERAAIVVENYIDNNVFAAEDDGRYSWGEETIVINDLGTTIDAKNIYRIRQLPGGSSRYGNCVICKKYADTLYYQTHYIEYLEPNPTERQLREIGPLSVDNASNIVGHFDCLMIYRQLQKSR